MRPLGALARKHWVLILLATIAGLLLGAAVVALTPKEYVAKSDIFLATPGWNDVLEPSDTDAGSAASSLGDTFAQQRAQSYVQLASSDIVLDNVRSRLKWSSSNEDLASHITVRAVPDTVTLEASATAPSAAEAQEISNAVATELAATIRRVEAGSDAGGSPMDPTIFVPAGGEPVQSAPDVAAYLVYGAVAGLLFGLTFTVIRLTTYKRILGVEDCRDLTNAPVLGALSPARPTVGEPADAAVGEDERGLRLNLQFALRDRPAHTIMVVPVGADALNGLRVATTLASSFAETSVRAVAVAANLTDDRTGSGERTGLVDIISGRAELSETLQSLSGPDAMFLPSGTPTAQPTKVLTSQRMSAVLTELGESFDHTLISTRALPKWSDALELSGRVDAAILVCVLDKTSDRDAARAAEDMRRAGIPILGSVLLGADAPHNTEEQLATHGTRRGL
jgi:capsular polysaccharide biosynthesis protein/Mrp family chromosome partitioning ATPase